jgi:hypothetical protein
MMVSLRKIYLLPALLVIFYISCGDDNKTDNLRYSISSITDFNVYAGSETGANKIEESKYDSSVVFIPAFETYTITDSYILFDAGYIYVNGVSLERSQYRFADGNLFITTGGTEQYYGKGNEKKLTIRQHYVGYKSTENSITLFQGIPKDKLTLEDALKSARKTGLPPGDTIMWATRESIFQ